MLAQHECEQLDQVQQRLHQLQLAVGERRRQLRGKRAQALVQASVV
jgi:hypothetical protein